MVATVHNIWRSKIIVWFFVKEWNNISNAMTLRYVRSMRRRIIPYVSTAEVSMQDVGLKITRTLRKT